MYVNVFYRKMKVINDFNYTDSKYVHLFKYEVVSTPLGFFTLSVGKSIITPNRLYGPYAQKG